MDRQTGELISFPVGISCGLFFAGQTRSAAHSSRIRPGGAAWGHSQFPTLRDLHTSTGTGAGLGARKIRALSGAGRRSCTLVLCQSEEETRTQGLGQVPESQS